MTKQNPRPPLTAVEFNRRYPVGTPVAYRPSLNAIEGFLTHTRTTAWEMSSGEVLVMVDKIAGSVSIRFLTVLELKPVEENPANEVLITQLIREAKA